MVVEEEQWHCVWDKQHPHGVCCGFSEDGEDGFPCRHLGVVIKEVIDEAYFISYEDIENREYHGVADEPDDVVGVGELYFFYHDVHDEAAEWYYNHADEHHEWWVHEVVGAADVRDPGLGVERSEYVYEHQRINSGEESHPHHVVFFQQVAW